MRPIPSCSAPRIASMLALVAALAGTAPAQERPVAFPHGATTGLMGNWAPLGEIFSPCGSNVAEARTHILIPAEFLPPRASLLWALEHRPTTLTSSTYPCAGGRHGADRAIRLARDQARASGAR